MGHRCLSKRLQHPSLEEMLHFQHRPEEQGKATSCSVPEHFICGWALLSAQAAPKHCFIARTLEKRGFGQSKVKAKRDTACASRLGATGR